MPSSTSSSNDRIPGVSYGRLWAFAALFAVVALAALEGALRLQGFETGISDDSVQWSLQRQRLESPQDKTIAVLGASRAHLGFAPDVFESRVPEYSVANLSVNGHEPLPVLYDIAFQSEFSGIVLMSFHPDFSLFVGASQQRYVDYYQAHFTNLGRVEKTLDRRIENTLQGGLVVFSQAARWTTLLQTQARRPLMTMTTSRFMKADYRSRTPEEMVRIKQARMDTLREGEAALADDYAERYRTKMERVADAVRAIQDRGGRVVFVRYPSSGDHFAVEQEAYPRAVYWDRLADLTGATTIHWLDDPELSKFEPADMSHLDYRDAEDFTARLAQVLVEREVL